MNKLICRCNCEFQTISELLEHRDAAHSAKTAKYDSVQYRRIARKPAKPVVRAVKPVAVRQPARRRGLSIIPGVPFAPHQPEPVTEVPTETQAYVPNDL